MSKTSTHTVYKLPDGMRVPSVTTVLGILEKEGLHGWIARVTKDGQDWRSVRDAAADAGTLAHSFILAHLKGEKLNADEYSNNTISQALNSFKSYLSWETGKSIKPILVEQPLVTEMGYGGTPDLYAEIDGVPSLVDFKTGKALYSEYEIQIAAYNRLLLDNGYDPAESWRLLRIGRGEDDGYEERYIRDIGASWQIFVHCLEIYKLQKLLKEGK